MPARARAHTSQRDGVRFVARSTKASTGLEHWVVPIDRGRSANVEKFVESLRVKVWSPASLARTSAYIRPRREYGVTRDSTPLVFVLLLEDDASDPSPPRQLEVTDDE